MYDIFPYLVYSMIAPRTRTLTSHPQGIYAVSAAPCKTTDTGPPEPDPEAKVETSSASGLERSLKFSRNVVAISIEDPDVINLSFVDLPGLIQNEEQEVIDLVQGIAVKAISRPNTIILTMIPMSDDMQNQQSVRLAREADPDGERVPTKPDTLDEGAINAKTL
ncbi:hypothetical protein PAXINDRAFT_14674 [Paxillus involutus ATCC 200175]|uniref:Dynamin N-terminal domain-containing protein n=1 Tax=Paxillus involutus ATCC 200175 TaxID=664439 RepID=A0A0C9TA11_PAXIN|nr:hypothetical protein PAXINDRAFT_14674 [Paxillus involutus ATCC 200175]